ncbi:MAG: beta-lactamase family protein [Candidatus Marinimicrobia bacterium]|nr:beta-lactamase family protein [Candidatus Neomarinimicrobiota bacterium]
MLKHLAVMFSFALLLTQCAKHSTDQVDTLFEDYSGNKPGAAIMIIHDGEIILNRCYGLADMEQSIPVTDSSNFRLASMSKQFTAMAILQLMEKQKLTFSTSLREVFPEFPAYAEDINYGHLLHHTSGLIAYENLIADSMTIPVLDADVLGLVLSVDSTYFEPGTAYRYSNTGYAILALTVERLTGQTYPNYLETHIFGPLGMNGSLAYVRDDPDFPNRALGYSVEGDSILYSDQSMTSSVLGDGGIYSSTRDLYKWDQALYGTELILQAYLDSAFTPWLEDYGCGWRIENYRGKKRISHTGSSCGFRTDYQRFPEDEFSVIILTNRRDPGVQVLAEVLTDIYLFGEAGITKIDRRQP